MNHVLLWKEYRQQRAIWLVIALLGILLVLILGLAMGQGSGLEVFRDGSIRPTLITIILALGVTYGIVCGALLLAGEKEDRTLDFLDGLAGERGPVWRRKATAGALFTLAQGLVMALLIAILGLGSWRTALIVLYWCLDGLAWGLLGGSLCQKVLLAVLAGIAFMACSWLPVLFVNSSVALYLSKAMLAGAAVLSSRRIFCQDDPSRQTTPPKKRFTIPLPAGWRSLLWLSFRQGRWVLAGGLVFAIALGLTVNLAPLILWPIGTLLLGLACGLAAFCPDQGDGGRFLGAQRFSPGKVWSVKTLSWGISAILLTVLAFWMAMYARYELLPTVFNRYSHSDWVNDWIPAPLRQAVIPLVFFGLWPVYGFFVGHFLGLLMPRPVLAVFLAIFITPLAVGIWVPSLVFGGVPIWQLLLVPVLLLMTTRLAIWPWTAGRLTEVKPLLAIAGAVALMVLAVAGCLWHRAVEVPDVGEPFDVKAYIASLPPPEKNEAGPLLRKALKEMAEHKKAVEAKLDPPSHARDKPFAYRDFLVGVYETGWPKKDQEIGRWLDQLFQGDWVQMVRKAAQLPLGMLLDPRQTDMGSSALYHGDTYELGMLLMARALQSQARGESQKSLELLGTALALSRQLKNQSSRFDYGYNLERPALAGFSHWLNRIGPDKKMLRKALEMLQRHEAESPVPSNMIKAEYLVALNSAPDRLPKWCWRLINLAYQVPWEKQRQERILRAVFKAQMDQAQEPTWQMESWGDLKNKYPDLDVNTQFALLAGLPLREGPGSNISAARWGELITQTWLKYFPGPPWLAIRADLQLVRAAELVTAIALYQSEKGEPPARLDDLVPGYLKSSPIDPTTGKSFGYRISKGEEIKNVFPDSADATHRLAPGQALVWSEGSLYKFPVPVWKK